VSIQSSTVVDDSCYTNHALDQFLEHLLGVTDRIVRIGSRSKSEQLEQYNLHERILRQEDGLKSRYERTMEWTIRKKLEEHSEAGNELCETIRFGSSKIKWPQIVDLLRRDYPSHYAQLVGGVDSDGFTTVGRKGSHNFFGYWKYCNDIRDREEYEKLSGISNSTNTDDHPRPLDQLLLPGVDIWEFSRKERRRILEHWESLLREEWIDNIFVLAQLHREELDKWETLRSDYFKRVLENADVIGLTTTGLARYDGLIDRVNSKTLICEEAGEVLEVGSTT
jgi:hypothetical protein